MIAGAIATGRLERRYRLRVYLRAYRRVLPLALVPAFVWFAVTSGIDNAWDAHAYWNTGQGGPLYATTTLDTHDAYLYSPAFAQAIRPLTLLSWEAFIVLWTLILGAALYLAVCEWTPLALVVPSVNTEFRNGNIHMLLAAVLVWGFRWPALWALPILTKPTIGICLLWFVARREWRKLATAIVVTCLIVSVSVLLSPVDWGEWIASLLRNSSAGAPETFVIHLPLAIRLPIAAAIVVVGALRGWRWIVPPAAVLAAPVIGMQTLSMLVACLPLGYEAWVARRGGHDRKTRMARHVRLSSS